MRDAPGWEGGDEQRRRRPLLPAREQRAFSQRLRGGCDMNALTPQTSGRLQPDAFMVADYFRAIFRYASDDTFVSFRSFRDNGHSEKAVLIEGVKKGDPHLVNHALRLAEAAAMGGEPVVLT